MLFQSGEASLRLDVASYEFPAGAVPSDNDDQNWLVIRCTWRDEDGELRKDSNSCLMTYELREMTAGLKVVNAGIRDRYDSDFTEPWFKLSAQAEGGAFQVEVSFFLPNTMDGDDTAELSCSLSRDEMKALVDELDKLCEKFPDRL
ncbi:MAG: hypothetical protein HFF90_06760 [Oscillibacter sp.]|nr:hypothetical protein [Oscillibacter sp.]